MSKHKKPFSLKTLLVSKKAKKNPKDKREDDDGSSGGSGGRRGGTAWGEPGDSSILADETRSMDRKRRLLEQEGHRHHARVNARERPEQGNNNAPEGELQNNIKQNPWLDSQRFDGVDNNLNPEPPLNSEARKEFDNQRREQEKEKQLRLGNMPKMGNAPKPQGP